MVAEAGRKLPGHVWAGAQRLAVKWGEVGGPT